MKSIQLIVSIALGLGLLSQSATVVTYLCSRKSWGIILKEKGQWVWTTCWGFPFICHVAIALLLTFQHYPPFCFAGLSLISLYTIDWIGIEDNKSTGWRQATHLFVVPFLQMIVTAYVFLMLK